MTLEAIYNKQQVNITKQVDLFNARLVKVLKDTEALSIARLKGISQADVLRYDAAWREILQDSGYYRLVQDYLGSSYDSIYKDLNEAFNEVGLGSVITNDDIASINAIKQIDNDFFIKLGDDAGLTIKKALNNYVLAGLSPDDMILQIRDQLQSLNLDKYAQTYAQTSISNFNQAVINFKSLGEVGVWIYRGDNDAITRDYCRCILNQHKYYDDLNKSTLENDTRRRWNCRHLFYKVSAEYALSNGFSSGIASC